jgi:hypothetical protein
MELTIPVRLTEEDIAASACDHFEGKKYSENNKMMILRRIVVISFTIVVGIILSFEVTTIVLYKGPTQERILSLLLLIVIVPALLFLFLYFPRSTKKRIVRKEVGNFRRDHCSLVLHVYSISAAGIMNQSSVEKSMLHWEDVHHLSEYSSCFVIEQSTTKKQVIPRRCFSDEQQLINFRSIATQQLPAEKYSMKGLSLGNISPDEETCEDIMLNKSGLAEEHNNPIYSITYQISPNEVPALCLSIFLHSKTFKELAVVYFLILVTTVFGYGDQVYILWLIIIFPFFLLFALRKKAIESVKSDRLFGQIETVSLFSDRLVTESNSGSSSYFWNTICRIKRTHTCLLIYYHPGLALVIPARCINAMSTRDSFYSFVKSRVIEKNPKISVRQSLHIKK